MPLLGKSIASAGLIIASGLSLSACATEDYVDKHIATVNDRISALEARVNTVDQSAQQANAAAQAAAGAAQTANQRLDQLTARSHFRIKDGLLAHAGSPDLKSTASSKALQTANQIDIGAAVDLTRCRHRRLQAELPQGIGIAIRARDGRAGYPGANPTIGTHNSDPHGIA